MFKISDDILNQLQTSPFNNLYENGLLVIAGPCAVEERKETLYIARNLAQLNRNGSPLIHGLRGGAYKPRTSPESFQGKEADGLDILVDAKEESNLPIVTEIMDPRDIPLFLEKGVDVFQVGSRNMWNYRLLKELAQYEFPVLLKRGFAATFRELKGAVGYLKSKHPDRLVLFCLRGLQKIDYGSPKLAKLRDSLPHQKPDYRYFNDVGELPQVKKVLKEFNNVLVGFDPSHISGNYVYVPKIAKQGVEHGASFLLIETIGHEKLRPTRKCDGDQALGLEPLEQTVKECNNLYKRNNTK